MAVTRCPGFSWDRVNFYRNLGVICALRAFFSHVVNRDMGEIVNNFGGLCRELTSDRQLCWVRHVGGAAVKRIDAKQLLFCMDFRYITDVLTDEEAYGKSSFLQSWTLVPSIFLIFEFSHQFRVKVGADLQDDICRCRFVGEMIGPDKIMMLDANKQWEIKEAIEWVTKPSELKPLWIKEPTFPDEDMPFQTGHATISKAGDRVIFKQLLQANALSYFQIDSWRLGSVNENLSVLLMAKKFQSKALQNAYGLGGLSELVQHLIIFNYILVSESLESRLVIQNTPVAIDYGDSSFFFFFS
uniref:Enolase C-terminal domain-containing protein n=1 Tax=Aquila chrysaetos chrysaetos TaxID=223781 RepID=A0A663EES4_AQUCH